MITLRICEAEETFLEKVILPIPEAEGHIKKSVGVADASDAVFSPPEHPRPCVLVWEIWRPVRKDVFHSAHDIRLQASPFSLPEHQYA